MESEKGILIKMSSHVDMFMCIRTECRKHYIQETKKDKYLLQHLSCYFQGNSAGSKEINT